MNRGRKMTKPALITSPHTHDGSSVSLVMVRVCLALLPGLLAYSWFFGAAILLQCLLCIALALGLEALLLKLRGRRIAPALRDGSAAVTGLLFALMITPLAPWWVSLLGLTFGLTFAKHLYGGLGNNLFNPAVTAYLFVLLSFPAIMNNWPTIATNNAVDAISGATPLADMQNQLESMAMVSEIRSNHIYGHIAGAGWEWVNMGYLVGGIALILMGVIGWRIPVAVLGSLLLVSLVFSMNDAERFAPVLFHLFSGGIMLGAFFIATDPVTASGTPLGKLIYGCIIGIVAYVIRVWGAYPDGVAFAVLLANSMVPVIDRLTRPRVMGEKRGADEV